MQSNPELPTVAFIGLGVMGFPMAGHLAKAGYQVQVYNRSSDKAQRWAGQYSGTVCATPRAAAQGAQCVFTCVGNDDDLRAVLLGEQGALAGLEEGAVVVDHSTVSVEVCEELAELCQQRQASFVDAPISGGQQGAENGVLTVMCGGSQAALANATAAIDCYARAVTHLGPVGSGQRCKMVNQICIAGLLQGLAEGLNFAQRSGLDPAQVVDVISRGAAQSWQMENRAATMLADHYEHGFAVDWMVKDLGIAQAEAERNGSQLPVAATVANYYQELQKRGGGRWDTSSLLRLLQTEQ
ncbi:MAG: NAD(P)-dependent oxidoreductase [Porticoccaceae bacterium]